MRASGILLAISSLPSKYGIGCFSKEAYSFVDKLVEAGQAYWQILPLGPTGYGDSPYQSFSAFAGNPYFIDLEALIEQGLISEADCTALAVDADPARVDYEKQYTKRYPILRKAFAAWLAAGQDQASAFVAFCDKNQHWLEDYSLFMAAKQRFDGKSWSEWPDDIRLRQDDAINQLKSDAHDEILFWKFLQFQFMEQWEKLRAYANSRNVRIVGDIPIYAAFDSSDSWAHPDMFRLDEDRRPVCVAGCPPDAFAAEGQLWGNPIYDWQYHEQTGFSWWIERMERCFELYDVVRVDHFRGFDEYYVIPYGDTTAARGKWETGPGMKLFSALKAHFGEVPIIAEDLGYLTDTVIQLVKDTGYPGMKLIEFAFDSREAGDYMPYGYPTNCVVYTGTHDNQTLAAWYDELTPDDRELLDDYLGLAGASREEIVWNIIRLTLSTAADTAIIPMQDYLCLGKEARMNRPSTLGTNWQWRLLPDQFTDSLAQKIKRFTYVFGRNLK